MRELLPLGAMDKPQLPIFLTSWVDKSFAQCMYTMAYRYVLGQLHISWQVAGILIVERSSA
jgi:hypothetical protein